MKVLVVEDEAKIAAFVERGLSEAGIGVTVCGDGEAGCATALAGGFDAIVLDIMLPGRDGLAILTELREQGDGTPVIFLTARSDVDDRVRGLATGADDYLTKPFYVEELIARLHAVTRRGRESQSLLRNGELKLDLRARDVSVGETSVDLTTREFALLQYLLESSGRALTRTQILEHVWHYDFDPDTNVVDVYIKRLRQKLGDARGLIETVRGIGYRMTKAEPS